MERAPYVSRSDPPRVTPAEVPLGFTLPSPLRNPLARAPRTEDGRRVTAGLLARSSDVPARLPALIRSEDRMSHSGSRAGTRRLQLRGQPQIRAVSRVTAFPFHLSGHAGKKPSRTGTIGRPRFPSQCPDRASARAAAHTRTISPAFSDRATDANYFDASAMMPSSHASMSASTAFAVAEAVTSLRLRCPTTTSPGFAAVS